MGSLERKLARRQQKEVKKKLVKKLNMFDRIPEQCLVCEKSFNKKDKEQVFAWKVVLREERINLYCPTCWEKAEEIIKDYMEKK